jgi:hypothetical protein
LSSSSGSITAPVGFEGLFTTTARVFGVIAFATPRAVTRKAFLSVRGTNTGVAPATRAASANVGQAGTGTTISLPRSRIAW